MTIVIESFSDGFLFLWRLALQGSFKPTQMRPRLSRQVFDAIIYNVSGELVTVAKTAHRLVLRSV